MNRGSAVLITTGKLSSGQDYLIATRNPDDGHILGEAYRNAPRRIWTVIVGTTTRRVFRRRAAVRLLERLARDTLIRYAIGAARLDTYRPDLEDRMAQDRGWRT